MPRPKTALVTMALALLALAIATRVEAIGNVVFGR
jgi:hypothetical protein